MVQRQVLGREAGTEPAAAVGAGLLAVAVGPAAVGATVAASL